jgi:hypothetical protein
LKGYTLRLRFSRKAALVATAVVAALTLGGGAAYAVFTSHAGSTLTRFQAATETNAWAASPAANTYVTVPGAAISVTVPAGTARMHQAVFSAESQCLGGTTNSWCSVRVIRIAPNGVVTELNPASSTDFAFDTSGGDNWQAGSISRTGYYVGAGTYRFVVQAAVVNGATTVRLDDWNFSVTSFAP